MRVLLIDDHGFVRRGIKLILQEAFGDITFGEAGDGQEGLDRARAEPWDIVMLDMTLPIVSGSVVLKSLKQEQPDLPVLILSIRTDPGFVRQCLKVGAAGYLCKPDGVDEVVAAVRAVLAGGTYLSAELRELGDLSRIAAERGGHETG